MRTEVCAHIHIDVYLCIYKFRYIHDCSWLHLGYRAPSQYNDRLSSHGDLRCKDRRALRPSYLYDVNPILVRRCIHMETAPRFSQNGWHLILLSVPTLTSDSNETINEGFWICIWPYLSTVMLYLIFGNTKTVLHVRSFFKTEMAQVFVTVHHGSLYPPCSISWLLMAWRHKELGHQQLWYWNNYPRLFRFQQQKAW